MQSDAECRNKTGFPSVVAIDRASTIQLVESVKEEASAAEVLAGWGCKIDNNSKSISKNEFSGAEASKCTQFVNQEEHDRSQNADDMFGGSVKVSPSDDKQIVHLDNIERISSSNITLENKSNSKDIIEYKNDSGANILDASGTGAQVVSMLEQDGAVQVATSVENVGSQNEICILAENTEPTIITRTGLVAEARRKIVESATRMASAIPTLRARTSDQSDSVRTTTKGGIEKMRRFGSAGGADSQRAAGSADDFQSEMKRAMLKRQVIVEKQLLSESVEDSTKARSGTSLSKKVTSDFFRSKAQDEKQKSYEQSCDVENNGYLVPVTGNHSSVEVAADETGMNLSDCEVLKRRFVKLLLLLMLLKNKLVFVGVVSFDISRYYCYVV